MRVGLSRQGQAVRIGLWSKSGAHRQWLVLAGWLLWKQIGVKGRPKAENYGRGPWQEGLRNSTLYVTLVALQYKCILAPGDL